MTDETNATVTAEHRQLALNTMQVTTYLTGGMTHRDGDIQLVAQALANAEARGAAKARRWIPVAERLPEDGQAVLIWGKEWMHDALPGIGTFDSAGGDALPWEDETPATDERARRYSTADIECWMPAPSPPESAERGGGK